LPSPSKPANAPIGSPTAMKSMTGFGSGEALSGDFHVEVELHSVNQRGLQVQVQAPREWGGLDTEILEWLRERMSRGKINVGIRYSRRNEDGQKEADWEEIDRRVHLLQRAMDRHGIQHQSLAPEVLYRILVDSERDAAAPEWKTVRATVMVALEQAGDRLLQMRAEEGARLKDEFTRRVATIQQSMDTIRKLDQGRTVQHRDALLARLQKMDLELDPFDDRVAREVAFLADRSDISEELTRVDSHLASLAETLDLPQPIGRKLEFLLQELHREFNTIGSKCNLPELATVVIDTKQELEKLREQAANVE